MRRPFDVEILLAWESLRYSLRCHPQVQRLSLLDTGSLSLSRHTRLLERKETAIMQTCDPIKMIQKNTEPLQSAKQRVFLV